MCRAWLEPQLHVKRHVKPYARIGGDDAIAEPRPRLSAGNIVGTPADTMTFPHSCPTLKWYLDTNWQEPAATELATHAGSLPHVEELFIIAPDSTCPARGSEPGHSAHVPDKNPR